MAYQPPSFWAPALVVGGAILASGFVIKSSLDNTSVQLDQIRTGIVETRQALNAAVRVRGATPPAGRGQRGPDPAKKYTIQTAGRPTKGNAKAKIEIVEFSDFQ